MNLRSILACLCWILVVLVVAIPDSSAKVTDSSPDGFRIEITLDTDVDSKAAFETLVELPKWYDASHSYSGEAKNLKLDFEKQCLLETTPHGFVRHMEIVYFHRGETLRLSGGLGPLQSMGVSGAMTFSVKSRDGGSSVKLVYEVCGRQSQKLDKLAPVVDRVLQGQMDRLKAAINKAGSTK